MQKHSSGNLIKKDNRNFISIYSGELTQKGVAANIIRIKAAFPSLPIGFYEVIMDRLKDAGFTDERFTDAVNNVIDTCEYPNPTIAKFLKFDEHIELLTYKQMTSLAYEYGSKVWDKYQKRKIGNKMYWFKG